MVTIDADTRLSMALRAAIRARPPEERRHSYLSLAEVGVLFKVPPKTIARAREDQEKALNAVPPRRIDPLTFQSLTFVLSPTGSGRFLCRQDSAFELFERIDKAAEAQKERIAASMGLNAVLAFHGWTCEATPTDKWPFSIQRDGRPLEFCAALLSDKLTGEVEWLTLREFADQLAHASAKAFHNGEASAIGGDTLPGIDSKKSNSI